MSIDTAEKRKCVAGIPFYVLGPGVTPNASKDAEWRQQVGWGYCGIAAGAAGTGGGAVSSFATSDYPQSGWRRRDYQQSGWSGFTLPRITRLALGG